MRTPDVEPIVAEEMAKLFDLWADQAQDVTDMKDLGKYYKEHETERLRKALEEL